MEKNQTLNLDFCIFLLNLKEAVLTVCIQFYSILSRKNYYELEIEIMLQLEIAELPSFAITYK